MTVHQAAPTTKEHERGPSRRIPTARARPELKSLKSLGRLELELVRTGETSRIGRDFQSGCLKVRSLRPTPDGVPTVALINTAGGLTGGDELNQSVRWHSHTHACVTTPAAEKIYRSAGGRALIVTRLQIADEAHAEWLPQETILFDGGRIERNLEIELEGTATIVACDGVVFGRLARDEILGPGYFSDTLKVWRDGRMILFDRTRVDGSIHAWLDGKSTGRGNRAAGMVLVSCARPEALLVKIRTNLADLACLSGASLVRGLIHVRLLARDDIELRAALAGIVTLALDGRPVPRNWSC